MAKEESKPAQRKWGEAKYASVEKPTPDSVSASVRSMETGKPRPPSGD